jgi:hypothetical protein
MSARSSAALVETAYEAVEPTLRSALAKRDDLDDPAGYVGDKIVVLGVLDDLGVDPEAFYNYVVNTAPELTPYVPG